MADGFVNALLELMRRPDRSGETVRYRTASPLVNITDEDIQRGINIGRSIGPLATYPIAPRGEWYGDANFENTGGRMTTMTPDEFLSQARPMKIDEVARENIDDLKSHIQSGKTLDPLALYKNGKEDGRHRAIAAKELGINEVPVLNWREPQQPSSTDIVNAIRGP